MHLHLRKKMSLLFFIALVLSLVSIVLGTPLRIIIFSIVLLPFFRQFILFISQKDNSLRYILICNMVLFLSYFIWLINQ